jgi:hypothetical protein
MCGVVGVSGIAPNRAPNKKTARQAGGFFGILQGSLLSLSFRQRFEIAIKIEPEGGEHGKAARFN